MALGFILLNSALLFLKASEPSGAFDITMTFLSWLSQVALGSYLFFTAMFKKTTPGA
jgi:hypothetical protein